MSLPAHARPAATLPGSASRPPLWYRAAWVLALPLVAAYLLWRSRRQPEYRQHWAERFLGRAPLVAAAPLRIWVHAVSVGETRAAQPMLAQLAQRHPEAHFVLTHMTPTGRAAGAALARALPGRISQRYLPYDLSFAVARFFEEVQPQVGVLMETEIWPQLLHAAHGRGIPMVLANARLSPRSLAKALRLPVLMRRAATALRIIGAQSAADQARFAQVYDGPIVVTGNGKFDMTPDAAQIAQGHALRARLRGGLGARPLWLFASTREGEEALIVAALRALTVQPAPSATPANTANTANTATTVPRSAGAAAHADGVAEADPNPPPLCLFVPRHPQRFADVAALLSERGARVLHRADWDALVPLSGEGGHAEPMFLLGDSMGEMPLYYAMADVALIGGSLLPLGGQNLIEACACDCPVVLGPHMFNFAAAADDAVAAGAARRAADAADALRAMAVISADPAARQAMQAAARAFAGAHRGATARTVDLIEQALRG